jgi:hypothetical protein
MKAESQRSDASFYLAMSIVAALVVFAGFAPSFYLKSVIHAPVPPLTQLTIMHGIVFTAWMALFLTQASLIAVDKVALHRQLGIIGSVLIGAMFVLGCSTAITAARLGHTPPGAPPPLAFLALPLMGITATLFLVVLALVYRRRSDWHKRLMIAALFTLTPPAVARLCIPLGLANNAIWIAIGGIELLLLVSMLYDYWSHRRVHPAYWVAASVTVALHLGIVWAFSSPVWIAIAKGITQT